MFYRCQSYEGLSPDDISWFGSWANDISVDLLALFTAYAPKAFLIFAIIGGVALVVAGARMLISKM